MDGSEEPGPEKAQQAKRLIARARKLWPVAEGQGYESVEEGTINELADTLEALITRHRPGPDAQSRDQTDPEIANEIHGWCPVCAGSGMVMGLSGTDDCPNLDAHQFIVSAARRLSELEIRRVERIKSNGQRRALLSPEGPTDG